MKLQRFGRTIAGPLRFLGASFEFYFSCKCALGTRLVTHLPKTAEVECLTGGVDVRDNLSLRAGMMTGMGMA